MKAHPLIWLSLALNLALGAGIFLALRNRATDISPVALSRPVPGPNTESPAFPGASALSVPPFRWGQIASGDFQIYRDNLRAAGCPEKTIREIIQCVINQKFNPRRQAILASFQNQFWSLLARGTFTRRQEIPQTEWGMRLETLRVERQKQIDDVLGKNYPAIEPESSPRRASADKQDSLAANWAADLAGFEPTEAEWQTITRLRSNFDQAPNDPGATRLTEDERQQEQAALEAKLAEDIKNSLGTERYAEYQFSTDGQFREVRKITQRYGLPDSIATQAYQVEQEAIAQASQVRNNQTLSAATQQSLLTAIQQETRNTLAQTLGSGVFLTYQEYNGDWLQGLSGSTPIGH
jgi:hypothetical protein